MKEPLSRAEQAEAFRIRTLIGPMEGRADELMERIANQIECGEFSFNPETQIVFMPRDLIANPQACQHVQILPDGRLRFF